MHRESKLVTANLLWKGRWRLDLIGQLNPKNPKEVGATGGVGMQMNPPQPSNLLICDLGAVLTRKWKFWMLGAVCLMKIWLGINL